MTDCPHESFRANVSVIRLSHDEGGPIIGYTADITCMCVQCGVAMRFLGMPAGNSHTHPRVSIDGTKLRAPMEPALHAKFATIAHYEVPDRKKH